MKPSRRSAAIVGAGIAGLTAALSLSRAGFAVNIFEQAPQLEEAGAGLQLSPNATRIYDKLGLTAALARHWHEPKAIDLVSGITLRRVARVPAGAAARRRWGAPYAVIHRADLQQSLIEAAAHDPNIQLHTSSAVEPGSIASIHAALASRTGQPSDVTIGADGVWSTMRAALGGPPRAPFTGQVAWRMLIPAGQASGTFDPDLLTAFIGPGTHLVAYPLKSRQLVNLVAITRGDPLDAGWDSSEGDHTLLRRAFRNWSHKLTDLIDGAQMTGRFPIHALNAQYWGDRRLVLIGDAAHAMPPYAAQGAAMAIEDAYALARCLANATPDAGVARFIEMRRPRIEKVARRAAFNRFAYHARGPIRVGRDLVLALRRPEDLAADFDWLYGDPSFIAD